MILAYAIVVGLAAGFVRALLGRRSLQPPELESVWLVAAAFLPQWLAFHNQSTARLFPDPLAAGILVTSQALLLVFIWRNRDQWGVWPMGLGVVLNFAVIVANGGFMPIFPSTVSEFAPRATGTWTIGERLWLTKDIVQLPEVTRLAWLSDRFLLPGWMPLRAVFSVGDVMIALGAVSLLWSIGAKEERAAVRLPAPG